VVLLSLQDTVQTGRYVVSAPSFLVLWWVSWLSQPAVCCFLWLNISLPWLCLRT